VAANDATWKSPIDKIQQAWQIPNIRTRLIFVLSMFGIYVLGLHTPAPYVNSEAIEQIASTGALSLMDIISGGAFKRLSILALGIIPYINASIIMQLLGIAVPAVQKLQKEGDSGRKVLSFYTRIGTVGLAIFQAAGIAYMLLRMGGIDTSVGFGSLNVIPVILVMAAGTSFLMWMGEQLTDKGIGNGVSLIIFAGIMIGLPSNIVNIFETAMLNSESGMGAFTLLRIILIIAVFLAIIIFITYFHQAIRNIPVQHAKRVVAGRTYGGNNSFLPLKLITAGVIPIIFASSVVLLPPTIATFYRQANFASVDEALVPTWVKFCEMLQPGYNGHFWDVMVGSAVIPFGAIFGGLLYFLLVVFFTYFYTAVVYNVQDIADNLKKQGSFVPGLRPGKQTEDYIDMVLTRITFAGALFLGVVALLPYIIPVLVQDATGYNVSTALWGGTSLLIVVGVAIDTMKQLEALLVTRHYDGFIK